MGKAKRASKHHPRKNIEEWDNKMKAHSTNTVEDGNPHFWKNKRLQLLLISP